MIAPTLAETRALIRRLCNAERDYVRAGGDVAAAEFATELTRIAAACEAPAPVEPAAEPGTAGEQPVHTYVTSKEYSADETKEQAVITRDDGKVIRSSWWGVADGSAECEVGERLRKFEATEKEAALRAQWCEIARRAKPAPPPAHPPVPQPAQTQSVPESVWIAVDRLGRAATSSAARYRKTIEDWIGDDTEHSPVEYIPAARLAVVEAERDRARGMTEIKTTQRAVLKANLLTAQELLKEALSDKCAETWCEKGDCGKCWWCRANAVAFDKLAAAEAVKEKP